MAVAGAVVVVVVDVVAIVVVWNFWHLRSLVLTWMEFCPVDDSTAVGAVDGRIATTTTAGAKKMTMGKEWWCHRQM